MIEVEEVTVDITNVGLAEHSRTGERFIMHAPEPSQGSAKYVAELVAAMAHAGMPVILFCPANFEYADQVIAAGAEIAPMPARDVSPANLASRLFRNFLFLGNAMIAQLRLERRGDIVHFQFPQHLPLGFVFYWIALLKGGKIVLTAHDPVPHRWRLPRFLRWLERGMLKLQYDLCAAIIVHNQRGHEILVQEFNQDAERVFIVPHGCWMEGNGDDDYPEFDAFRLLAFGAIRENKGIDLVIDAVEMLSGKSAVPVRLTIAGTLNNAAEEEYWQACKDRIARSPDSIEVIERFIEDEEVAPLIARHHALILPYRDFFSESGVATQSLTHRRPILATASGGLQDLLQQGRCGVGIETSTVDGVAAAISTSIGLGPRELQAMGIRGDSFLRANRSWEAVAQQTYRVYSKLLAS
jgi:glycosyltransferase involved in cell wall biosynthesis